MNGYHGDCSEMFEIGNVDDEGKQLIKATEICLDTAIKICKPNEKFTSIGNKKVILVTNFNTTLNFIYKTLIFPGNIIQETARNLGYTVLPAFGGHGIGTYFHGPPEIYHFGNMFNNSTFMNILKFM